MARPIEATPPVEGEDAVRLLRDLENCCSPEESERRTRAAKLHLLTYKPRADILQTIADHQAELSRREQLGIKR